MAIRTSRLVLRSARPDDLEGLHAVLSDPRATRWWSTPPHETLEQTRDWLDAMIANGPDHPDFVIELDGRVIGKAGFYVMPDVGYILHPDVWGQGLAGEAVGAVIDHVFSTRAVDTLTADPAVARILRFAAVEVVPRLAGTAGEITQVLRALNGRFITAGPSGSPLRGLVNVLPTGRSTSLS